MIAPILLFIAFSFEHGVFQTKEPLIVVLIAVFGLVLSIPSWLLFFIAVEILSKKIKDELTLQKILAPIGGFLTILPLIIFFGITDGDSKGFMIELV